MDADADRWGREWAGHFAPILRRWIAAQLAVALFPFGGAPWLPFQSWALRSGAAWQSPVRLLVHRWQGLMVSYRGALAFKEVIDLPRPDLHSPCDTCAAPCLTICPALTGTGYDVPACHDLLDQGKDCMKLGCASRRACPLSLAYARLPEHSAYHMAQFHRGQ